MRTKPGEETCSSKTVVNLSVIMFIWSLTNYHYRPVYLCRMPILDSLCLMRLTRPSLFLLCWFDTLQIWTTTSHNSLAVRRLSLGPGSSLQVEARSWPSYWGQKVCHRCRAKDLSPSTDHNWHTSNIEYFSISQSNNQCGSFVCHKCIYDTVQSQNTDDKHTYILFR